MKKKRKPLRFPNTWDLLYILNTSGSGDLKSVLVKTFKVLPIKTCCFFYKFTANIDGLHCKFFYNTHQPRCFTVNFTLNPVFLYVPYTFFIVSCCTAYLAQDTKQKKAHLAHTDLAQLPRKKKRGHLAQKDIKQKIWVVQADGEKRFHRQLSHRVSGSWYQAKKKAHLAHSDLAQISSKKN